MMKIDDKLLRQIFSDLGLNIPFVKGQLIPVRNCWHFSTDGKAVDVIFYDDADFVSGMNRIFVTLKSYRIVILAFSLMDNHLHFVLHGPFEECNRFMHDYVRRTSRHIAITHGDNHKMDGVPIDFQVVDTDAYLKTVICYTIKNAPSAGIPYNAWDYPWSSGPLYFRRPGGWGSPCWLESGMEEISALGLSTHGLRDYLQTRTPSGEKVRTIGNLVFPGEYVAYELVEKVFKTCKSFNYFYCKTKEDDVDARGGDISRLSIPMKEMRQHKREVCRELFGVESVKTLSIDQRLRLARTLRARFNSSPRQIAGQAGLVYDEVKDKL